MSAGRGELIVVEVPLGNGRNYPVLIGDGARHELASVLPPSARRVAVVTQRCIGVTVDPGRQSRVFEIGSGEGAKNLHTVEQLCSQFARWGLNRSDAVVAVGGGMVTDVGGLAAAVYHRGLPVVHVSTTLLGQIDAAIGGKTGVNLPEGKNLVGAFHQPCAVLCDTSTLATVPPRELRSGLGELAKYHFIGPEVAASGGGETLDALPLQERVAACVRIKAAIVASDERESERRAILNYGHTLAHALEIEGEFDLLHGEAVAIGLVYAAELARLLGRIDDERVAEHRRVVSAYDLPQVLPAGTRPEELVALFERDKKSTDGVTFVLDGPRGVEPVRGVERAAMDEAFRRISS